MRFSLIPMLFMGLAVLSADAAVSSQKEKQIKGPIAKAVKLLNKGHPRKAAKKLSKFLHSSNSYTNAAAHFYGGHCLYQLKKYQKAGKIWTSIAPPTVTKSNTAYYYYAARLATVKLYLDHKLKPPKAGMDAVGRSLKNILIAPPLSAVQSKAATYLGHYAERKHLGKQAIAFYKKGIALLKNLPANSYDPAGLKQTMLKGLSGRIKKVKKRIARRAAAKSKRNSRTFNEVAAQKAVLKARNEALDKNYKDAIRDMRKAIHLNRNSASINSWKYRVGGYYLQSGAYRQGFAYWNRFIDRDPTGPYRAQALLDMADYLLFKKYNLQHCQDKLNEINKSIRYIITKANVSSNTGKAGADSGGAGVSPTARRNRDLSASGSTVPKPREPNSTTANEPRASASGKQVKKPKNPYKLFLLTKPQFKILPASWQQAYCSLLRRRGLINWVYGYPKRGAALMEASTKYKPSKANDFSDARSFAGKRMKWLIDRMKSGRMKAFGRPIPISRGRHAKSGVAILLGEIYFSAVKLKPAVKCFSDVAHSKNRLHPSPDQRAFAYIRLGQCGRLNFEAKEAYEQYQTVLDDYQMKNTPWASTAALQSALLEYQAGKNWRDVADQLHQVYEDYPRSFDAANALYYESVFFYNYGYFKKASELLEIDKEKYSSNQSVREMIANAMKYRKKIRVKNNK